MINLTLFLGDKWCHLVDNQHKKFITLLMCYNIITKSKDTAERQMCHLQYEAQCKNTISTPSISSIPMYSKRLQPCIVLNAFLNWKGFEA